MSVAVFIAMSVGPVPQHRRRRELGPWTIEGDNTGFWQHRSVDDRHAFALTGEPRVTERDPFRLCELQRLIMTRTPDVSTPLTPFRERPLHGVTSGLSDRDWLFLPSRFLSTNIIRSGVYRIYTTSERMMTMETSIKAKRPRGRPRRTEPPRPSIHIPLDPAVKERLERDAKNAKRTIRKEIELRIEKSYLHDEIYGGPELASLFHELAEIAVHFPLHKKRDSFFDDFEMFVSVTRIWDGVIAKRMPRPDEEILAEALRTPDAAPQTPVLRAARKWFIQQRLPRLAEIFAASAYEQAAGRDAGTDQQARDTPPEETAPASAREGDHAPTKGPVFVPLALLGTAATPSANQALFGTVSALGSLIKAMDDPVPLKGSVHAAAGEISRWAHLCADVVEPAPASDASAPPAAPAGSAEEARF
jgi:hypothetical protein